MAVTLDPASESNLTDGYQTTDVPSAPCSESTLTDRYQTTIPDAIRKVLGLNKRDKICYTIQPDGQVVISRAEQTESDPILGQFLNFLAQDIKNNPQHLQAISSDLVSHVQSLVSAVDLDLNAPLSDEDE
jgi:antitoxin PrlF